jgi:hypothetical protein
MALVLKDRVKETTTTTGTGTLTLLGAASGFQSFSVIGDGNTTYYTIDGGTEWEVGIGTYTSSGTTLSRDTILESSNGGTAVNFSAGTKNVFVTYPAERALYTDASSNAIALGTPASATLTNATGLPISTGVSGLGTGVATFLATPSSANLRTAITDETGTGAAVFATSPTLVTPVLGTPSSGTLTSCTGLPLTTGVTGTLPIANGGTNLTTYTTGDIVYASATNTLNKLADVATGNALISGGVGVAPSYGKIGLTTHVSGTLPIANGGTGTTSTTFANLTTNVTGTLPVANGGTGITSLGAGVATFLGTPSSANLASAVTNETGSGSLVFATSPTLVTPALGTPSSGTLTNCTFPTLNQNTTGSAATVTGNATGSTFGFNSGYGSVATAYGCRAWVNFNGTGTVAIRASGNVSSVTDNAVGQYTVNFTTTMPDENYTLNVSQSMIYASNGPAQSALYASSGTTEVAPTTSAARITITTNGANYFDAKYILASVFR